jgi:hypothetical protein
MLAAEAARVKMGMGVEKKKASDSAEPKRNEIFLFRATIVFF